MMNIKIKQELLDENPESHLVHLDLTEKEVNIYFDLFEERIKKHETLLKRVKDTVYENIIKKEAKMREHNDIIYLLKNMYAEMTEQAVW